MTTSGLLHVNYVKKIQRRAANLFSTLVFLIVAYLNLCHSTQSAKWLTYIQQEVTRHISEVSNPSKIYRNKTIQRCVQGRDKPAARGHDELHCTTLHKFWYSSNESPVLEHSNYFIIFVFHNLSHIKSLPCHISISHQQYSSSLCFLIARTQTHTWVQRTFKSTNLNFQFDMTITFNKQFQDFEDCANYKIQWFLL